MHLNTQLEERGLEAINAPERCLDCLPLPAFDEARLEEAREGFRGATVVELGQPWRMKPEAEFRAGRVRMGWRDEALLVLAELEDEDIFSRATGPNQRTWELGDVFEIFLRPVEQSAYVEFHVTPDNHRLALRFPDEETVRGAQLSDGFEPFFLEGNVIESRAWVLAAQKKWFVFARIPAGIVCDYPQGLMGQKWLFSFSRYDYRKGCERPVLSTSSLHQQTNFHCQPAWYGMRFCGSGL